MRSGLSSAISMQISWGREQRGVWFVFSPDPRHWNETTHTGVETLFAGINSQRSFVFISMFEKTMFAVRIELSRPGI